MKVLIADDSPVLVTALRKLLEQSGYEVVPASDGLEAVQKFYQENPDLVLLDIQMPKLHGYVVCRLIKEDPASRHIPVLILTGRDSAEDRYWGNRSGADGYLTKESMGDELLDAIQSALASRALSDMGRIEPLPQSLNESDVLSRVCEVLDRKLFEATIVNDIVGVGVRAMDLEATVGESLNIVSRILDFDAAAIVLPNERRILARFGKPVSAGDLEEFRSLSALRCRQFTTADVTVEDLIITEVKGGVDALGDDRDQADVGWPSFSVAPLWSRGEVVGVLVLGSQREEVFGESTERTLRTIEPHVASVVDSARHYQKLLEQEARSSLSSLFDE
ncbi:MAG: response regulator [Acidimicrobiia bacterium]|nr:response regulator [Acidimicrobiia bacterium]